MELVEPFEKAIHTEAIHSFSDASTFLVTLLHEKQLHLNWVPLSHQPDGSTLVDHVIDLVWQAEKPVGVEQLIVMAHPLLYYRIQKDCSPALSMQALSSSRGYSGTIIGHPFFSHARLRKDTLLVAAKTGQRSRLVVSSPEKWQQGDSLFA